MSLSLLKLSGESDICLNYEAEDCAVNFYNMPGVIIFIYHKIH